jgi:hypothetical protein
MGALHPTDPAPFEDRFDLTTSKLAADGATLIPDESFAGVPDGVVDRADFLFYVENVLGAIVGDLDFDGVLSSAGVPNDFSTVNNNVDTAGGWASGDLDFDGVITENDVTLMFQLVVGQ